VRESRPRPAGYVLKPSLNVWKYPCVALSRANVRKSFQVHTLVAYAFLGPRPTGMEINHRDGVKTNAAVSNLEYLTKAEHTWQNIVLGQTSPGERNGNAKLTEAQVRLIRSLRGKVRQVDIAADFGVSQLLISKIQRGESWKHVPLDGPVAPVLRGALADDEVREIRRRRGITPQSELAALYGLSQGDISKIHLGKTYRHVPMETPIAPVPTGGVGDLPDTLIRQIRALRGVKSQREIASLFGVEPSMVCRIQLRQRYGHVSD
jgi:hypothetical protein